MGEKKYQKTYPDEILAYFRSFLGYWERRLTEVESRIAAETWQKRAEMIAERQREAFDKGEAYTEDVGAMLDPESIMQGARVRAYEALMAEMKVKRRLQGLPEFVKWANKIGITTQTIRDWRRKYEKFDKACKECEEIQRALLKDGGLAEIYASKTVTFLLETVHGMRAEEDEDADESGGLQVIIRERASKEDKNGEDKTTDI